MSDPARERKLITYLNTDLDIEVSSGLPMLSAALLACGKLYEVASFEGDGAPSRASFECSGHARTPEAAIAEMLGVIEQLDGAAGAVWQACSLKEFNIGYACGEEPSAFSQRLSPALLQRIAAVAASVSVTIYPSKS